MRLYSRLWISLVIMVVVATFPPSLSSTCSKPINLYREGKLERVDEGKLNMNLCPIKQTQDGQLVQTILKVIQRWAPITSCPGRANNTNESPIFACRFPDTNITGSSAMGVASWIMDTTVDVGSEDTTVNPTTSIPTKEYWSAGDPNDDHKEESACLRVNVGWNILRMHGKWRDRECRKFSYKSVCQKDLE
ncbi:uncharacterized protein LOC121414249 isoform X2 [Lytechinus variegatus]|uniref:uncharacterized protein LOC121414249 isoform X2 n=1 Tax=Lytechinus variegatus TaxID=7654 RepID=UPI001BB14DC7|nr:uncharacterized protein LOC121414249 isoform X2 [Lytechinus variegatus]